MKIRFLFTVLTAALVGTCIISCQKAVGDPQPDTPPVEAGASLPSRIEHHYIAENLTEVYSIQYDTANQAIRIFLDDTTTANPYDALRAQYDYNEAGYLVKCQLIYEVQERSTSVISRDANNQIRYITELDVFPQDTDTTFFTYSPSPAGTVVETDYHYPAGGQSYFSRKRFTYSSQWQLLQVEELEKAPYIANFQYSQDLLTGYVETLNGTAYDSTHLEYTSGLPDGGVDRLHQLLCGKDHYLIQIKGLNFFNLIGDGDYFYLSVSDPQHPTRYSSVWLDPDNGPSASVTTYTYQVNSAGQVIRIAIGDEDYPEEVILRY